MKKTKMLGIVKGITLTFGIAMLSSCQCSMEKFEISPTLTATGGTVASVGSPIVIDFAAAGCTTQGADPCVLQKLQRGLLKDFNDAKAGKVSWVDYNRNRNEALNLITSLNQACKAKSGQAPGSALMGPGKSYDDYIEDVKTLNTNLGY